MPYNPSANMSEAQLARMDDLAHLYSMSRSIKCFAIIDIFLVTLWALQYWFCLLLLPFPILGYWGAKRYQPGLSTAYGFFLLTFGILGRGMMLMMVDMSLLQQMLQVMVICIQVFILRIVVTFVNEIRDITDDDRLLLEMGPVPVGVFF